jgi:hypothetical protein
MRLFFLFFLSFCFHIESQCQFVISQSKENPDDTILRKKTVKHPDEHGIWITFLGSKYNLQFDSSKQRSFFDGTDTVTVTLDIDSINLELRVKASDTLLYTVMLKATAITNNDTSVVYGVDDVANPSHYMIYTTYDCRLENIVFTDFRMAIRNPIALRILMNFLKPE